MEAPYPGGRVISAKALLAVCDNRPLRSDRRGGDPVLAGHDQKAAYAPMCQRNRRRTFRYHMSALALSNTKVHLVVETYGVTADGQGRRGRLKKAVRRTSGAGCDGGGHPRLIELEALGHAIHFGLTILLICLEWKGGDSESTLGKSSSQSILVVQHRYLPSHRRCSDGSNSRTNAECMCGVRVTMPVVSPACLCYFSLQTCERL